MLSGLCHMEWRLNCYRPLLLLLLLIWRLFLLVLFLLLLLIFSAFILNVHVKGIAGSQLCWFSRQLLLALNQYWVWFLICQVFAHNKVSYMVTFHIRSVSSVYCILNRCGHEMCHFGQLRTQCRWMTGSMDGGLNGGIIYRPGGLRKTPRGTGKIKQLRICP